MASNDGYSNTSNAVEQPIEIKEEKYEIDDSCTEVSLIKLNCICL